MNWKINKYYDDLNLYMRISLNNIEGECYSVDFEIFNIYGIAENNEYLFEERDSKSCNDITNNLDEAQTLIKGSIKWDGCSHVDFGEGGYIHGCDPKDMTRLGVVLGRAYEEAKSLLSNVDYK